MANQQVFERLFRWRMSTLAQQLGRQAREFEFKRSDVGRRLVTAAYRYYGGFRRVCLDLGYTDIYVRPKPSPRVGPSRRPVYGHWTQRDVQVRILREHFAGELSWGYFPRVVDVKREFGGLACHWLRTPEQWRGVAASFRLRTYERGRQEKAMAEAVLEAITLYEQLRRHPVASECSNQLRHRKFDHGISWSTFERNTDFHPRVSERLLARWKEHYRWCSPNAPGRLADCHQIINGLIVSIQRQEPFGRSSP